MFTFLFKAINISLDCEDWDVAIEYLDWVVEDLALDGLPLLILLQIFGEDFGVALYEESSIVLMDEVRGVHEIYL